MIYNLNQRNDGDIVTPSGTVIFSASEGWNYLDSAYFCLTSLLKIGFGDFVPGSSKAGSLNMQLYVDYCYLLIGMGIVAMNYYLLVSLTVSQSF